MPFYSGKYGISMLCTLKKHPYDILHPKILSPLQHLTPENFQFISAMALERIRSPYNTLSAPPCIQGVPHLDWQALPTCFEGHFEQKLLHAPQVDSCSFSRYGKNSIPPQIVRCTQVTRLLTLIVYFIILFHLFLFMFVLIYLHKLLKMIMDTHPWCM